MKKYYWMMKVQGVLHFLLAVFHVQFWWLFEWEKDLQNLTAMNRNNVQLLNAGMVVMLLLIALACLRNTGELITTRLGFDMLVMITLFYLVRWVGEFFFLDEVNLITYLFGGVFALMAVSFFWAAMGNLSFRKQMKKLEGLKDHKR